MAATEVVISLSPSTANVLFTLTVLTLDVIYLMFRMATTPNYNPFSIDSYDIAFIVAVVAASFAVYMS